MQTAQMITLLVLNMHGIVPDEQNFRQQRNRNHWHICDLIAIVISLSLRMLIVMIEEWRNDVKFEMMSDSIQANEFKVL